LAWCAANGAWDAVPSIGEVASVAEADGVHIDRETVLHLPDSVPESMESSMQCGQGAGDRSNSMHSAARC